MPPDIQIVTPVHNGAAYIGQHLTQLYEAARALRLNPQLIVCEDGSTDHTVPILRQLSSRLPLLLITDTRRKGYSQAVLDGLSATTSDLIVMVDSDGQYYPSDLSRLYGRRHEAPLIIGYRHPRRDPFHRLLASRLFKLVYYQITPLRLRDPSSPFLLIHQSALRRIISGSSWHLPQGFWWEFYARAHALGIAFREVPIRHRSRPSGRTDVYLPAKLPSIAYRHLSALFSLKAELKKISADRIDPTL